MKTKIPALRFRSRRQSIVRHVKDAADGVGASCFTFSLCRVLRPTALFAYSSSDITPFQPRMLLIDLLLSMNRDGQLSFETMSISKIPAGRSNTRRWRGSHSWDRLADFDRDSNAPVCCTKYSLSLMGLVQLPLPRPIIFLPPCYRAIRLPLA